MPPLACCPNSRIPRISLDTQEQLLRMSNPPSLNKVGPDIKLPMESGVEIEIEVSEM
jgi:hypothetical protein